MRAVRALQPLTVLAGQHNGEIDPSVLVDVGDGHLFVTPAATAARRMFAAAKAEGITLGWDNTYRPLEAQEALVRARYTTTWLPGQPSLWWNGARWWLIPGNAVAASPGTSNHGWGRAGDLVRSAWTGAALAWLELHAVEHGFCWELPADPPAGEPWHLAYFAGDTPPDPRPATTTTEPHPTEEPEMIGLIHQPNQRPGRDDVLDFTYLPQDESTWLDRFKCSSYVLVRTTVGGDSAQVWCDGQVREFGLPTDGRPILVPVTAAGLCSVVGRGLVAEAREFWA